MTETLITTALTLGLGLLSTPSFAGSYVVNGRAASPAEAQHLVATGVQPCLGGQRVWHRAGSRARFLRAGFDRAQRPEVLLGPRRSALRLTD
jgi:hypothetical protein